MGEAERYSSDDETYTAESNKPVGGGYTYWKRTIDDAHLLPNCEPQKIESPSKTDGVAKTGLSLWNALGTWEERDLSNKVRARLARDCDPHLQIPMDVEGRNCLLTITADNMIDDIAVEASVCYVRGRAKFGYDVSPLNGVFTLTENDSREESLLCKGDLKVPSLTDHDDDPTVIVTFGGGMACNIAWSNRRQLLAREIGIALNKYLKALGNDLIEDLNK